MNPAPPVIKTGPAFPLARLRPGSQSVLPLLRPEFLLPPLDLCSARLFLIRLVLAPSVQLWPAPLYLPLPDPRAKAPTPPVPLRCSLAARNPISTPPGRYQRSSVEYLPFDISR